LDINLIWLKPRSEPAAGRRLAARTLPRPTPKMDHNPVIEAGNAMLNAEFGKSLLLKEDFRIQPRPRQ